METGAIATSNNNSATSARRRVAWGVSAARRRARLQAATPSLRTPTRTRLAPIAAKKKGHVESECFSKHARPIAKGKNSTGKGKGKGKGKGEPSKGKGVRNINEDEQWEENNESTADSSKARDWTSPPGVNTVCLAPFKASPVTILNALPEVASSVMVDSGAALN
eukprot:15449651-Alexandrium_andersonii.AAC.1